MYQKYQNYDFIVCNGILTLKKYCRKTNAEIYD